MRMDLRTPNIPDIKQNVYLRNLHGSMKLIFSERITRWSAITLGFIFFLGVIGPIAAPFEPAEQLFYDDGSLKNGLPPMTDGHWMGTTAEGRDVLSQILYGARPTILVGLGGGLMIILIGMSVGITAGYFGGKIELLLMRLVDFVYAIPIIPFAILMVVFFRIGLWTTILIIGIILWRGSARVLRSQVLQIKERPYIEAARMTGASNRQIVLKHIVPNISSMIVLFFALGIGISILVQANLAFIGISEPFQPTWGVIIRNAYRSGRFAEMWWWSIPPGLLISMSVLCTYLLGRGYEVLTSDTSSRSTSLKGGY